MKDALRILIVEDERVVARSIAVMLGDRASKVTRAANGWQALIRIGTATKPFDVIITDHRMPRMTGLQFVSRLREQNVAGKIMVLSGHLTDNDTSAYEKLKVDVIMSKPFGLAELQQAMAVLGMPSNRLPFIADGNSSNSV